MDPIMERQNVNKTLLQSTKDEKQNRKIFVNQHCFLASSTQDTCHAQIKT
jgi:hypothetical protein